MTKNRVTEILGSDKPIIQAPMDWITDAKLVAAVNAAGGFGFLAPNAGQTTNVKSSAEAVSRMKDEIEQTKALTGRLGCASCPAIPKRTNSPRRWWIWPLKKASRPSPTSATA